MRYVLVEEMTEKMKKVRETITSWAKSKGYPSKFLDFFFHWTLINLYYNEFSKEKEETLRVLDFGRNHEHLFPDIKEYPVELSMPLHFLVGISTDYVPLEVGIVLR